VTGSAADNNPVVQTSPPISQKLRRIMISSQEFPQQEWMAAKHQ
jgi:hypothetical protein